MELANRPLQVREPPVWYVSSGPLNITLLLIALVLLVVGLSFDWTHLLTALRFPTGEVNNPWVRAELRMFRGICVLIGTGLIFSRIVLWGKPQLVARLANKFEVFISTACRFPLFIPLSLTALVLVKTILQLSLYLIGYTAYGADDFSRSLSADYWLYHRKFDLGWEGWLGLGASGWLPFSDYLFGLGLALHRDLYLTPKIVNLIISGISVIVVYLLGRELFGRTAGFLAAALFAFQPWHVWLGISGMTSELPSAVLVGLFGLYLVRWLRTDASRSLLAASGTLGLANGFRYENWFFSAVFSVLIVFVAFLRWRRASLGRRWITAALWALGIVNAVPIVWMIAGYVVLGDWLPALHATNAWMISGMVSPSSATPPNGLLAINQAPHMVQMNMLVLALGSFPLEITLSILGIGLVLISVGRKPFPVYLVVLVTTALVFAAAFKGHLPASIFFARYFLPFIVFLLPYAGYFLLQLFRTAPPWREEGVLAVSLITVVLGVFNVGRAFNYPAVFPKDAISAGWMIRGLQNIGTISDGGKILIERATDFGDLGIVALANRPERFVALNELLYHRLANQAVPRRRTDEVLRTVSAATEDVRGTVCDGGFHIEACRNSIFREEFKLVILSSPSRVASFQDTFPARSWHIGRYHIFDMTSLPSYFAKRSQSP